MTLTIATTQPAGTADARENGRIVRELMREAAAADVRLIQFPEGFLSGYAKEQIADWAAVDWAAVRDELNSVADLAAELGMWVVLGSAHPLTPPNRPHNSLYVISDQGQVVTRYDKRFCSNTEITRFYSPGFEPITFDIDGYRFGLAICIEVNFPQLFAEYDRLGVDCLLLSAWPVDKIFFRKAQAHAAIQNYWLSLSVPAQSADLMSSAIIGPDGSELTAVSAPEQLATVVLDRDAPEFHIALDLARPWRAEANQGDIYRNRRVEDPRSSDRTLV
ncbi:carbon-nitrogen hydrolase family protein [Dactylosporangium sp. AC04546]|uniref:carbon-nitrogen hydrolase family protein n=1 Tax=Dactylosporangium sp. AC04546 TaxID=2862460 RepID=UPI001EDDB7AF|nr:carbon-nitrogen hydrolase family protein [Dactylosporangium sp. AC04546]WVK86383.1 carbon-nitrogen hydrolase family protein [Dactylosporangium sp. AC04546]